MTLQRRPALNDIPECRVNEWCMLVDIDKARPATQPYGKAAPVGALFASGAKTGFLPAYASIITGVQIKYPRIPQSLLPRRTNGIAP